MMSPHLMLWVTTSLLVGGIIQKGLTMNLKRYQEDKQELDYEEVMYESKAAANQTTHRDVEGGDAVPRKTDPSVGKLLSV